MTGTAAGRRRRMVAVVAIAMAAGMSVSRSALATGSPGTNGMPGAPGQGGGPGGQESVIQNPVNGSSTTATARGGPGGTGGPSNARPFRGGPGGAGGTGTATLDSSQNASGGTATGIGGVGGVGGQGLAGSTGMLGSGTPGGDGGAGSEGFASAFNNNNGGSVTLTASAIGGAGGQGGAGGAAGTKGAFAGAMGSGGAGGVGTLGTLGNLNASGDTTMFGNLTGGAGGFGNTGGAGGSENFSQTSGSSPIIFPNHGSMALTLDLTGGNGGTGIGAGGGAGGSANGTYAYTIGTTQAIGFNNVTSAYGGTGGDTQFGNGGAGGSATANQSLIGGNAVIANAYANSPVVSGYAGPLGAGGNVTVGTGTAGIGGNSIAQAAATSTSSTATAITNARGGNGGSAEGTSGNGGNGGFAQGQANANGVTAAVSNLYLYGGNGGSGSGAGFSAGSGGGIPAMTASAGVTGNAFTTSYLLAYGGSGGFGANGASGGDGASVTLDTAATVSSTGSSVISQIAYGGNSGGTDTGPTGGTAGAATSEYITNYSSSFGTVTLNLGAYGGSGMTGDGAPGLAAANVFTTGALHIIVNVNYDPVNTVELGARGGAPLVNGANAGNGAAGVGTLVAITNSTGLNNSNVVGDITVFGGPAGSIPATLTSGNGGTGGPATGSINCGNEGPEEVDGTIDLVGGAGGTGKGIGFSGGNGGVANAQNSFLSSGGSGMVVISISAVGGLGGDGQLGAKAGNGASTSIVNAASGLTAGELDITQNAYGGHGGNADGGIAGVAGDATSSLTSSYTSSGIFNGDSLAIGGNGGGNQGAAPSAGGASTAQINLTAVSDVNADANAGGEGGGGGSLTLGAPGLTAGRGGDAIATATAMDTGSLSGTGNTSAFASAMAGTGGAADAGNGGNGGAATATATATTVNPLGDPYGEAHAHGGTGGISASNGVNGTVGPAIASASGYGINLAVAFSSATSLTGSATALAKITPGTTFTFVQSTTITSADNGINAGQANASAVVGGAFTIVVDQPSANLIASPSPSVVTDVWTHPTATNVKTAFNNDATKVFALADSSLQKPTGSTIASSTVSTSQEINLNGGSLSTNDLAIGLPGVSTTGTPLQAGDSLRFVVTRNGATLVDRTMTSMSDEVLDLNNCVYDLGPELDGETRGNLDLQISCTMTNLHTGTGVSIPTMIGSIAPSSRFWDGDSGGLWNYTNLWGTGIVPDGPGTGAIFGGFSNQTVFLDSPTTIGSITINTQNSYVFSAIGNGRFIFDNDGAAAQVIATGADHAISAPITVTSGGLNFVVQGTRTLTVSGNISGAGSIACTSFGNVVLNGSNSYTGPTTVTHGKLTIGQSLTTTSAMNVQTGARAELASGGGKLLKTAALSITGTGVFDLNDNAMVIDYNPTADPIGNVMTYLQTGFNGGNWLGNDLTSTLAANAASQIHKTAIGFAEASSLTSIPAVFGTVDGTSVLIRYTFDGDSNLDGTVNMSDFNALALHYGSTGQYWNAGDFNYDGVVNLLDLNAIATNYGQAESAPPVQLGALVPEPVCLMPFVAVTMVMRRKRRTANGPVMDLDLEGQSSRGWRQ